ncbi:phosphoribosylanthranilate isomerase [Sphingomonadales bacterium 56]|uniref:phosphoribosylanthranilate isomerase n=1 Tax=unclassified Sphingobium TaxID=2611147 RepID=UPI001917F90C|nr:MULTISPECIES: phosphoribosylanthranilate isomerase [unclassified Sphingobium]MBY2927711.1 phosphoribosylanthranilate isomerase [Sphingomonadales bacterium 56]MBY2957811.1 phosphoribosylanthranilate isomerase [Sphingomonadales bacterium 58]CAD7335782.1 N-(5'-phosphoribosyl)anthranilate isomerase [Sphingobium sp. S6]CAD7335847.1 N-(5'-phosphoribosyl)anthranilate isomerase [Sphingobium sp. S8]
MPRLAIKICGLSTPDTIGAAVRAGATHLGFVHFAKSPRHVEADQLRALASTIPAHVERVAVLVDPTDETLAELAATKTLTTLQLHGKESPERAAAIAKRFELPVWKAISVKTRADIDAARAYAGAADFLLFDAKTPDGAALPGGMGLRFDWTLLRGVPISMPWGLSGGLGIDNVAEAIRITGAPMIDVSSGVESAPGIKSVDKIMAFCKAAQQS